MVKSCNKSFLIGKKYKIYSLPNILQKPISILLPAFMEQSLEMKPLVQTHVAF